VSRLPAENAVSWGAVKIYATTLPRGWDKGAKCRGSNTDINTWIFTPWFGTKVRQRHLDLKAQYCDNGCPIRQQCLQFGKQTHSTGLFGGEFLDEGKILNGL
jgi:hypothetical protein